MSFSFHILMNMKQYEHVRGSWILTDTRVYCFLDVPVQHSTIKNMREKIYVTTEDFTVTSNTCNFHDETVEA